MSIFDSVRSGDVATLDQVLKANPGLVHAKEQGRAPLHWAAGAGNLGIVTRLVAAGANIFERCEDERTPYQIALAAKRRDVAAYLQDLEVARDPAAAESSSLQWKRRLYCRAYRLGDLRKYSRWTEKENSSNERSSKPYDTIVYLHQDFSVTETAVPNSHAIFASADDDWQQFCLRTLAFRAPTDLETITGN